MPREGVATVALYFHAEVELLGMRRARRQRCEIHDVRRAMRCAGFRLRGRPLPLGKEKVVARRATLDATACDRAADCERAGRFTSGDGERHGCLRASSSA